MTIATINHIEIIHDTFGNKRIRIAGTQIRVQEIVIMHTMNDSSVEWIAENYDLTPAQIHAALSYYYDHQSEMDVEIRQSIEQAQALAEEVGRPLADVIAKMRDRS